jgi:hypothetical protein
MYWNTIYELPIKAILIMEFRPCKACMRQNSPLIPEIVKSVSNNKQKTRKRPLSGFFYVKKGLNYFTIVISSTMCLAPAYLSITHKT